MRKSFDQHIPGQNSNSTLLNAIEGDQINFRLLIIIIIHTNWLSSCFTNNECISVIFLYMCVNVCVRWCRIIKQHKTSLFILKLLSISKLLSVFFRIYHCYHLPLVHLRRSDGLHKTEPQELSRNSFKGVEIIFIRLPVWLIQRRCKNCKHLSWNIKLISKIISFSADLWLLYYIHKCVCVSNIFNNCPIES